MTNRIYYITTVSIDDQSAQASQIKNMTIAFNKFAITQLIGFKRNSNTTTGYDEILFKSNSSKLIRSIYVLFYSLFKIDTDDLCFTRDLYIAVLLGLLGKRNVIWEAHQSLKRYNYLFLRCFGGISSIKVLAISKALADRKLIPLSEHRIYSYHDGVDLELVNNQLINFRNVKKMAFYSGALHKGKDFDSIIPLFSAFPDWSFYIAGGNEREVIFYKKLCSDVKNVKFLGRVKKEEVIYFQRKADILIYPLTRSNHLWKFTSPLKLFEYMASGRPILASNIGSVSEIISEDNAFIYDGDIDGEIVRAFTNYLISNTSKLEGMRAINRDMILTKYNWEARCRYIIDEISLTRCV